MVTPHSQPHDPPSDAAHALSEPERQRLRTLVTLAAEAIPLNWPMRTFISRNPLMGFEHLPFDQAVSQAKELFGGEGYLSNEEYRAYYAEGRISKRDLLTAIRKLAPATVSSGTIRAGLRTIDPEQILLLHLVHGVQPLDPRSLQWKLTHEQASHRIRPDVPESIRRLVISRAMERVRTASAKVGKDWTIAEWVSHVTLVDLPGTILQSMECQVAEGGTRSVPRQSGGGDVERTLMSLGLPSGLEAKYVPCVERLYHSLTPSHSARQLSMPDFVRLWLRHERQFLFDGALEVFGSKGRFDRISRRVERDPEASYVQSLWSAAHKALNLFEQVSHESPHAAGPTAEHAPLPQIGDGPQPGGQRTLSEMVDRLAGSHVAQDINDQMIKWCATFMDEGMADWSMPSRDHGFYSAWRDLAQRPPSGWGLGISNWTRKVRELPERSEDALEAILRRLGIPESRRTDYLRRHLAQLPGWAGYIKFRVNNPDYPEQARHMIDPLEYLTVRLFYEEALAETICRRQLQMNGDISSIVYCLQSNRPELFIERESHPQSHDAPTQAVCRDVWRLFHLAQVMELSPEDLQQLSPEGARTVLSWVDRFPSEILRPIWHEAYEGHYREALITQLASRPRHPGCEPSEPPRPRAQAVFCIDVRSEPFRRQLEAQGGYETIGFAGFFAVPICYRPLDQGEDQLLCPVLIKPKYVVREGARPAQDPRLENHVLGERWHETGHHLFHDLKASPGGSYLTIDLFGFLFGLALLGKTVLLEPYHRLRDWMRRWLVPPVPTHIPVEKVTEQERDTAESPQVQLKGLAARGFTPEEQALVVENALQVMSLTKEFARLVLLCGHGSTTENNPYASAYDCGACGGNHGGPNARVLAALANKREVRAELRRRGIEVPDDTWFVAGQHDTTLDRVTLLDAEDVPESHRQEWLQLQRDLDAAGEQNARERCGRLPGAPRRPEAGTAARHVWQRSRDWAQIRPEWGLSGNAAFIIGRRTLTRDLTLDGRTFLHNYDEARDETGKTLETIMTAPLVVAQWINIQYFFSAVDPWVYGSGSKVLHNVVSGIGVMLGRHSDLQTGLPLQSVHNGARLYHEPLRLLAIIEADRGRIADIISRHRILQSFFDNRWVHLVACDPATGTFAQYQPGGTWDAVSPQSRHVA